MPSPSWSLDLRALAARYRSGEATPAGVVAEVYERISRYADPAVWIHLLPMERVLEGAHTLAGRDPAGLPLYGVPFAVKDNLDLAGVPTTAGCPGFAYGPEKTAPVVERLMAAGAIPVGKTNLDQFATGLVGTRTPYGVCRNPFDRRYLPGGSSAGSAVAVAAGLVSFALGTDTAGSGRVPAAFTNTVGLKPTRGLLSTRGLVPAVRSLDCVSIFALTCEDAGAVLSVAAGFDPDDPFSRRAPAVETPSFDRLRVGVPETDYLEFFGDRAAQGRYRAALARLEALGCELITIDFGPFADTARMLYGGPWVAERLAAVGDFLEREPESVHPVVYEIIAGGARYDAVSAYKAAYRLAGLRRLSEGQWQQMDVLALPTTGTIYTVAEVERDPIALNANLGLYTNFVNLLDLCALAVPSGPGKAGLPTGITFVAPAWQETLLCRLGGVFHPWPGATLGATGHPVPVPEPMADPADRGIQLAVVGAHLSGQPLNHQLTDLGGALVRACRTAAHYRLFALVGEKVPKPGLVRTDDGNGAAIELEVWKLSAEGFGRFVANIPPPLGIGTLLLEDGEQVKGFLCESYAVAGAPDITGFGGWRAYLAANGSSAGIAHG
ncbi:allophanate hydrolase [Gloeobacter violaceus]|uniref:Glr0961 protein n=1 Tax=Gloeobacter violaceus (strain ATCC 29082 / PCC 7421) TaxID=251221 RepID=Q7NM08_GLOVI|nr:allophanate hydrolase [Gloeobacter violaceus]BAC88902.1 glr0961 [Gloeobacter violaceus PCC 7421]